MTTQLPCRERLNQIANFHSSMALPPSHDEIEAMARALLAAHEQETVKLTFTTEHRRVIEMLLTVCGAAFELADDSCEQEIDGEMCIAVPSDAFQKLSDALDEIENSLSAEDSDRPDVFLAWSAMPRAALKSLLHPAPVPAVPDVGEFLIFTQVGGVKVATKDGKTKNHLFGMGWNACRAAMLNGGKS